MNEVIDAGGGIMVEIVPSTKKVAPKKPVPTPAKKAVAKVSTKATPAPKKTEPKSPTDQRTKEIRWTPAKVALLATMKKLGATNSMSAKTPSQIAKASNGKLAENQVNHQVKEAFDLSMQDIIKRADLEEQGRSYYLSAKGLKIASKS